MSYRSCVILAATIAIGTLGGLEAEAKSDQRLNRGTGGIPAVLTRLDEISAQIERNQQEIQALQETVEDLESNTVPCTLDRFINDECGDYNQPFDLSITLCANSGANAGAAADFQINNTNEFHLGIGFAEILDVALVRNVEFPGIPGAALAGAAVYGLPFPNLQAGVDASVGVGVEGCIEIPVLIRDVPRDEIIALMQRWQTEASSMHQTMRSAANRLDLAPSRADVGLAALEVVQSRSLSESMDSNLTDPIRMFSRDTSHGNLIEALPIGSKIQEVLDKPEMLVESLSQNLPRATLANASDTCADLSGPNAPDLIREATQNMCAPLLEVPDFKKITNALNRIEDLPTAQRVKALICDNVTLRVLFSDCD